MNSESKQKMDKQGLILVFSTAVISGFAIFLNKYSVSVINPYIFTFLKNIIVALMLSSLILTIKNFELLKKLNRKQWGLILIIGLVGGSIPFLLFFKGLSLTSAAQGSLIHKTMFFYVIILAALFLKERIKKEFLLGVMLLFVGNLLFLKNLPISFGIGDLLVFLATLFWAVENTISKYTLQDVPATVVAWGRMFFGSIFILIYLTLTNQIGLISGLNMGQIGWTIITSIILFGYVMTWYSGLRRIPVSAATAILLSGSLITTLLSMIFGGAISPKEMIAGILIAIGLIFVVGIKQLWEQIRQIYVSVRA